MSRGSRCGISNPKVSLTLCQGVKVHRTHHLISNAERDYLTILEHENSIIDIREQFPLLTQAETQAIANSLNYRHPVYPGTQIPVVMTTDFLITYLDSSGEVKVAARSVKYRKEFEDANIGVQNRMAEKLAIEEKYWASRQIEWRLVLHENLSKVRIANLTILRTYASIHPSLPTEKNIGKLFELWRRSNIDCPSSSDASRDRACRPCFWSSWARESRWHRRWCPGATTSHDPPDTH